MRKAIVLFFLLIIFSCGNDRKNDYKNGFIIYNDFKQFYLVPMKTEFDTADCLTSLYSENLKRGILFHMDNIDYLNLLRKSSIEVRDEIIDTTYSKELQTLKILPVNIDYEVGDVLDTVGTEFEFMIKHRHIKFGYDHKDLVITRIEAVNCKR
jgi:hypothetical protein